MRLGWNEDKERKERGPSFSFDDVHDPEGELLEEPEYLTDPRESSDSSDTPEAPNDPEVTAVSDDQRNTDASENEDGRPRHETIVATARPHPTF